MSATSDTTALVQLSDDLANAVERAAAATVTVHGRRRMPATGIVWGTDGTVVTASHVVERDEEITVGLPDGRTVPARLLGRDNGTDLAVLKIEADDLTAAPRAVADPKVGHLVLAVGRPGPSGPMASFGVLGVVGGAWRAHHGGNVEGYLRADVAMLPGFSGGPLVDASGAILGLNSSTLGRGGGLTIPAATIDRIVGSIQSHGKVRRGFLGVGAQAVRVPQAMAESLGLPREQGLLVVSLEPDGPAEKGGLLIGDIIVALDGAPVAEVEELQDRLTSDRVGTALAIRLIRGGQPAAAEVTVGERA